MANNEGHNKASVPFFESFFKSQVSSVTATAADFGLFFILSRFFGVYYVLASAIGATVGAIISFFLGRHWAFRREDKALTTQAIKYLITSGISVLLNTYLIYWITEYFGIADYISKVIASILVGVFFNFLMFRYFVYR